MTGNNYIRGFKKMIVRQPKEEHKAQLGIYKNMIAFAKIDTKSSTLQRLVSVHPPAEVCKDVITFGLVSFFSVCIESCGSNNNSEGVCVREMHKAMLAALGISFVFFLGGLQ